MKIIRSIDDLTDERSKELARSFGISITEVRKVYAEYLKEMTENLVTELNSDGPESAGLVRPCYARKLACAAILCYELSKQDKLPFVEGEQVRVISALEPGKRFEEYADYCVSLIKLMAEREAECSKTDLAKS